MYLFGSHARGQAGPNSDLDILVVVDRPLDKGPSRLNEIKSLRRALARFRVAKDVLVYDRREWEDWKESRNHVIGRCRREGRLLYARPETH